VHDPNLQTGSGAWELAMRLAQLDLRDGPIDGGQLTDLTFGVNWYLSPYLRVTSNYIHAFAQHAGGTRSDTDIFAMRVGFDF
jgi:phosphate-selective porin OprO/OprP